MPSEANAMGSVSKQEEDTEKSNEQSVTSRTSGSTNQEVSNAPTNHINAHVANINSSKVSVSDMRAKYLNLTEDAVSSATASSVVKSDSPEAEALCHEVMTSNVHIVHRLFPSSSHVY